MTKLLFFGDFVATSHTNITISEEIFDIIKKCNIRACNFEAPVETPCSPIKKSGPTIFQSKESPAFLEKIGFNVIQLSNNHMFDYGETGLNNTLSLFKNSLLLGAGQFEQAYAVKIVNINGQKIGFMSLTHQEFGALTLDCSAESFGCAWINHPIVNQNIIKAKQMVDYLFVLPHAGVEDIDAPLPEWRFRYKEFIDLGADAVIASHPHIPQGWEYYKNKPIFYSLGNFYFESNSKNLSIYWNKSLAIEVILHENKIPEYVIHNLINNNGHISKDYSQETFKRTKFICDLIADEIQYMNYINKVVIQLWEKYYKIQFLNALSATSFRINPLLFIKSIIYMFFYNKNYLALINCIRCESHRWAILRALSNI